MEINWPIFISDTDGWMSLLLDINEVQVKLEEISIVEREYTVWDITGQTLQLYLDGKEIKAKPTSNALQLDKLKEAILNYAKLAMPKTPFVYSGPENDIIELFKAVDKAVEDHIKSKSITQKLKRIFKK